MRLTYVLCVGSSLVFCSAIAMTRQEQTLAEQQFKNIESFKGSKASDVIPAMEFMSSSLKVQCDFCHTEDRASDEKRAKKTAREMIAMQRDINMRNFGGHNEVTCATCHAGHAHPIGVPPVAGLEVRPRRSADVDPEQVLTAYSKAVGRDPAHLASGIRLEGTNIGHEEKQKVEATYSGEKYYFVMHGAKGDQKSGFNGSMMWFTIPNGVQAVPLVYAAPFVKQNALFLGRDSLPKVTSLSGATAKIGDRDMQVVSGSLVGETARAALYFDKKTGLLSRVTYTYPTVLGNIVQINDYSDYKKVAGVQVPMTIVNHTAEGDTSQHFTSARPDTKVDATVFDPPKKS